MFKEKIFEVENLFFRYQNEYVLREINLDIYTNDFLAIIGPNGGGKSTLVKLLLSILSPSKGKINLYGATVSKNLHSLGYVPQNTSFNESFPIKALDVVLMGFLKRKKSLFGYSKEEKEQAMLCLDKVGMSSFAQTKISDLSGGQRQRVLIARALCLKPNVLLLDEPTSSIDSIGQKEIYELLKELNKSMTVIVISHDISVILEYAKSVAFVNRTLFYHELHNGNSDSIFEKVKDENDHFCEVDLLLMLKKLQQEA